jgi:hypothetical protein
VLAAREGVDATREGLMAGGYTAGDLAKLGLDNT